MDLDIDEVARAFFAGETPDKHKDASKFMQKLSSDLVDHMKAKLQVKPSYDEAEALAKAKAKPTAHSLALTPDKREDQSSVDNGLPIRPAPDSNPKPTKKAKLSKDSGEDKARKLLNSPPKNKLNSRPKGATHQHVEDWHQTLKTKPAILASSQLLNLKLRDSLTRH